MRTTFLMLLVFASSLFATNVNSQVARVSIAIKNANVLQVIKAIESQTDYLFVYDKSEIDVTRKVDLIAENKSVADVLSGLFSNTNVIYAMEGSNIILMPTGRTSQQQKIYSGKVTDTSGVPLPGVSVAVKGTTNGTITDAYGNYRISNVAENTTLQFSFVGMKMQEIKAEGKTTINVTLTEETIGIEEVVAIGYGTTKKKDLTSSITTVNSKDFNVGAHTNVMQLLQGKVPGLNITKDGNPTGATSVMLRGPSTLRTGAAQEPLYVVDGVPGGIISSMDDVLSMDILRDASATAIYGSRAANGVIIVTTKRGEENNAKISYNAYFGVEAISNKIDMMSGDEYRSFLSKNGLSPDGDDNVSTNWMDEVTRLGISHNNNVSIGGGTSKTTYFASATYKDVQGIIKETGLKTLSMMANVKQKAFNDRLKVGLTITTGLTDSQLLPSSNTDGTSLSGNRDFLLNMINYLPTVSIKKADGTYTENFSHPGAKNPVALLEQNDADNRDKNFMGTAQVQFNVMKGLDLEMNASYQNNQTNGRIYYGKSSSLAQGYNGMAIRNEYEGEKKLLEAFGSYSKTIDRHDFKLLVGYSWQEDVNGNGFQSSNTNFISDEISYNNLGLGSGYTGMIPNYGTTAIGTLRMISGYARVNYSFANKYLFQATVRRDGSSAFGTNNRWGTFPSASIGWRILEESFMKNQHIFDNLKLRAGYGISGNSLGFDPLISKLRYATSGKFYSNGSFISGITPTQNENPDLKWESTSMLNIGLDFSALKGRLSGTVEWYDKITKDLIWAYSVPATEYYVGSLTANVGEMENKGWEVSLSAIPVKTTHFIWNTTFNVSFNHNNINSLSNDKFQLSYIKTAGVGEHGQSGYLSQIIEEGHPIGQFYIWKYAGHNSDGVSQFYKADGTTTINPSPDDHFYEGNAQPKATGGWYNSFNYKRFSLDLLFRGVTGNKILDVTRADLNYPAEATHYNMPLMTEDEPINDTRAHYSSSRYLEKGDYIRLENVTLAYSFKIANQAIKNLRIYSTVNNVFVITGYKGMDPEVYMGGNTPGIDNGNFYPKTRTFIFGVNVDF
jgi:iron complex outermembrane receptor protein